MIFQRFQKQQNDSEATPVNRELNRNIDLIRRNTAVFAIVVVVFLLVKLARGSEEILPVLSDTAFGVTAADGVTYSFRYEDMESVELCSDLASFDRGTKISGTETRLCWSGTYENSAYGEYQLHVMPRIRNYIIVQTAKETFVFNIESDDTTAILYDTIREELPNPGTTA